MASNSTMKVLSALTVALFIPTIVQREVARNPKYRRLKVIPRLCDDADEVIKKARDRWPKDLKPKETDRLVNKLKFVEENMFGPQVHICLFLHFACLILQQCVSELWDAGSRKGGALNEVLRCLEDLHERLRGESEEGMAEDEDCRVRAVECWGRYVELWGE